MDALAQLNSSLAGRYTVEREIGAGIGAPVRSSTTVVARVGARAWWRSRPVALTLAAARLSR
ncbi:MAG TPA: hypothetical protein VHE78_05990 [Gemmatimonadaceae bacterium]|nr:hypothetical protein [Gemmatimonadaceae bacterium]